MRSRLMKILDAGLDRDMTLICAPAGFGKSVLLAQWQAELLRRNIITAWLNLDRRDEDSKRCLAHIAAAFKAAGDVKDTGGTNKSIAHHKELHDTCLGELYDYINHLCGHCVLILDAYDQAASPELNQALRRFLELMPDNLHLVIGTRIPPVELTARLWEENRITVLTAPDMRFTREEIIMRISIVNTWIDVR